LCGRLDNLKIPLRAKVIRLSQSSGQDRARANKKSRPFQGRLMKGERNVQAADLAAGLALAASFLRFKYATRRFFFSTLLYCRPIRIFTSLKDYDFVMSL
jgi:hypothetical protein